MTNEELKAAQARIGCSGDQLAKWLGVTPITVTRWRTGRVPVPRMAEVSVGRLEEGWRP